MSMMAPKSQAAAKPIVVLPQTPGLLSAFADIRDRTAPLDVFVPKARRIIRLLMEAAINLLPHEPYCVATPSGGLYHGQRLCARVCGVSVLRAGDSMEAEFRIVLPHEPIGKILIQRDTQTKLPRFYFAKLPDDIAQRHVLVLDPMLATGGTAVEACAHLASRGVDPNRILFVSLLAAPEGVAKLATAFPDVQVITASLEASLNAQAFMLPGIGDFGDRFFGTWTPHQS